jgi:adenylosuccinate synthase
VPYEIVNEKITPVYTELPGWQTTLSGGAEQAMPQALLSYIEFLERELNVPITLVSTGPDRLQTIHRQVKKG